MNKLFTFFEFQNTINIKIYYSIIFKSKKLNSGVLKKDSK
jgi:hypothetical protein